MPFLQTVVSPRRFSPFCDATLHPLLSLSIKNPMLECNHRFSHYSPVSNRRIVKSISCSGSTKSRRPKPEPEPEPEAGSNQRARPKTRSRSGQPKDVVSSNTDKNSAETFPTTIPRKPRRGRRSEAVAVEDLVRDSLERTFATIRQQNENALENYENIMKEREGDNSETENGANDNDSDEKEEDGGEGTEKKIVIEEESKNWPLDADVGWGIRASEYFEKHPIKNVVGEDGYQIDWEGEIDDNWVQEINCLEWESFAFHPSPLIVLVFERYNRATDNWKNLKELEKAVKVYWKAKDRLPPRAVKIDINIETDLAYALKVKECPQILFLRGQRVVYREKELRSADELVQMIAFFYYNAKKPAWIDDEAVNYRY
ncbi:unnamed protein product [Sphenostylis stenocarpa]|uniref:Thioredoxin-like fold domain-containing protein MRL7, chloroplastic n=1 Tax=Sphenostylis stenocarpa TaxID=92480 RepID=A0AA86S1I8_9FABA|nr:unnamed protein product [Sphenostylis stenocarpa]